MKLYLHNFLQDNANGQIHYPLKIIPSKVQESSVEYNEEMMENFVKRIDFVALESACNDLGIEFQVPEDLENFEEDQLKKIHHLLFEIEVEEGELVSPSGTHFPIISGIPDMSPQIDAEPDDANQEEEEDQGDE